MSPNSENDDLDLTQTIRAIWSERRFVFFWTALLTSAGVVYAFLAPEYYRAEVVVMAAEASDQSVDRLGALGGIVGLAGLRLDGQGSVRPIAVLKSKEFARDFIRQQNLAPDLLADQSPWVSSTDERDAVRRFDDRVRAVSEDRKTQLITISIEWKNAVVAARLANAFVANANERLRRQAQLEHGRNVEFLRKQMQQTQVVSLQQSIGHLIESEMQKLMLAQGREEFAFRIIDRATAPQYSSLPQRAPIVGGAFITGLLASALFVAIRLAFRRPDVQ